MPALSFAGLRRYEPVPLVHTDAAIDVRGLVASATVTQQYANASTAPIEAVYVFPLPHDAAVYDMEIRIGNRVIRSEIHEREEAKRVYEAAKSEGKRAALRGGGAAQHFHDLGRQYHAGRSRRCAIAVCRAVALGRRKVRLVFPMVVGPRYIPGTQAAGHSGNGMGFDTNAVPDASRITPIVAESGKPFRP